MEQLPPTFRQEIHHFKDLFTKPSYHSLEHLTEGIITCHKPRNVMNLHESLHKDERKSRTAYEYFFNDAKWDDVEVAQRKAEAFYDAVGLKPGDTLILAIDDTHKEKKGNKTDGVGSFYDSTKGEFIWGNNFITSTLQAGEVYILHVARMYLKEEDAAKLGEHFRTKPEIAYGDIISTLRVPEGINVIVIFDSWWYSKDIINKILCLGYEVIGQLKSDSLVIKEGITLNVSELASRITDEEFRKIEIKVRGKNKSYLAWEAVVEIEGIGEVKLVISKGKTTNFYFSTDTSLSVEEALTNYENRWNIETAHREGNQKLGFKDYQMRNKRAIERFMQLVFLAWAILLIAKLKNTEDLDSVIEGMKLGELLDEAKIVFMVKLVLKVFILLRYKVPSEYDVMNALTEIIG